MITYKLPLKCPKFHVEFYDINEYQCLTSNYLNTCFWTGHKEDIPEFILLQLIDYYSMIELFQPLPLNDIVISEYENKLYMDYSSNKPFDCCVGLEESLNTLIINNNNYIVITKI